MFCPNCRKELPEGTKFCGGCGTPISSKQTAGSAPVQPVEPVKPVVPVKPVMPAKPATPAAVANVAETAKNAAANAAATVKEAAKNVDVNGIAGKVKETVKKVPAQYIKIGAIALAALVVIILLVNLIGGSSAPNHAMYVKDEELMFSDFSGKAPFQVTEDNESSYYDSDYVWLTLDGKYLFYMDDGDTLFYRSATNFNKEPVELDSKVEGFVVSENGKLVTYQKKGSIYQHDLKEAEEIIEDVYSIETISPDGKIIYFYDEDYQLCSWYNGEVEEIEEDVEICYLSEDYKTVYYYDDDEIAMKKIGKDAEVIAEDVAGFYGVDANGNFYYTTYPEGDVEDYFDDADDYYASGDMNYLCTLYYYNGSKSKEVATNVYPVDTFANRETAGIVYYQFGEVEEDSLSFEEMYEDYDEESDPVIAYLTDVSGKGDLTFCIEGKTSVVDIELEDVMYFELSPDGKKLYAYVEYDWESGECDLLVASVSGGKVKDFEELDSGVYVDGGYSGYISDYSAYAMGNYARYDGMVEYKHSDYFVYFKDVENEHGELYVNGELVDEDVYIYDVRYNSGEDALVYFIDIKDGEGDLMIFNGKKSELIAEDVYSFRIHENGDIAFKYDTKDGEGKLALYTGKVKEVADDVYAFYFTADGDLVYLADYKNGEGDLGYYDGKAEIIDEDVSSFVSFYDAN